MDNAVRFNEWFANANLPSVDPHDRAALNEGREMFKSDEQFGQWVRSSQLDTNDKMDRAAAMGS